MSEINGKELYLNFDEYIRQGEPERDGNAYVLRLDKSKVFVRVRTSNCGCNKEAIQRSQARTLRLMNGEVLSLYYGIGRYISDNSRKHFWGTGALAEISSQLQKEMPGLKGFGETNLKDMRTFYEEWCPFINRRPLADDLESSQLTLMTIERQVIDENLMLREIRSSERNLYQQVTDIFITSVDYDPNANLTRQFFATVQNKQ